MNHSRYSLPSRIRRVLGDVLTTRILCRCAVGAASWCASAGLAAGQGSLFDATVAGNAPAVPAVDARPATIALPTIGSSATEVEIAEGAARPSMPDPQQLLSGSARMIARQKSIVAKVRHRATIYDRELIGSGEYAQGPELARLLRYQLRTQVDTHVVEMLQVADGRHLWISTQLKDEPVIERIDIDRVLAATDPKNGAEPAGDPNRQLGLGGLSQLVAAIERDFEFDTVFKSQLGGLAVYGIEGRWKRAALAAFDPPGKKKGKEVAVGGQPKTENFRPHVPDRVVLFLGVDDLFPYRIEYRRAVPAQTDGNATSNPKPVAGEPSKPLLVLEFFEVQFDVPLEERLFQFTPGTRRWADITEKFLAARKAVP